MGRLLKNRELDHGALAVSVPPVTSDQRPAGINGQLIYNTQTGTLQAYDNGWFNISTANSAPATITQDNLTGDGSTVAFTMSLSVTDQQDVLVFVGGVYQIPGTNYSVSGTTITFGSAPPADNALDNSHVITILHGFDSIGS